MFYSVKFFSLIILMFMSRPMILPLQNQESAEKPISTKDGSHPYVKMLEELFKASQSAEDAVDLDSWTFLACDASADKARLSYSLTHEDQIKEGKIPVEFFLILFQHEENSWKVMLAKRFQYEKFQDEDLLTLYRDMLINRQEFLLPDENKKQE